MRIVYKPITSTCFVRVGALRKCLEGILKVFLPPPSAREETQTHLIRESVFDLIKYKLTVQNEKEYNATDNVMGGRNENRAISIGFIYMYNNGSM